MVHILSAIGFSWRRSVWQLPEPWAHAILRESWHTSSDADRWKLHSTKSIQISPRSPFCLWWTSSCCWEEAFFNDLTDLLIKSLVAKLRSLLLQPHQSHPQPFHQKLVQHRPQQQPKQHSLQRSKEPATHHLLLFRSCYYAFCGKIWE